MKRKLDSTKKFRNWLWFVIEFKEVRHELMISSVEQNYFMNFRRPKDTRISQRVRVDCFALVNCESRFSRPLELWRSLPHYWLRYSPIACYYPYCCCFQSSKFLIYITFSMLLRFSASKSVIFLTSISYVE